MPVPDPGCITLTTDFGLVDPYVAAMKGVILGIAPRCAIVDVSHEIPPQHVAGAGFMLESVLPYFPAGTVHVVVVDPGVGTERLPIAVETPSGFLVGPDNGCMTSPLVALSVLDARTGRLLTGARAVRIDKRAMMGLVVSSTFHGRDIFAPVAARIASGAKLEAVGPALSRLTVLPSVEPVTAGDLIRGEIIHVDRFGNLISNIRGSAVSPDADVTIEGHTLHGLTTTYQERDLSALVGSTGYVEIAARNGSAAGLLGLGVGASVLIGSSG